VRRLLKSVLRGTIRTFGYDLRSYDPASSPSAQLKTMLAVHGVNLIFDVGANIGQFGESLRGLGYRGEIVSFEPLNAPWKRLAEVSKNDSLWTVADRVAIGSTDGEIEINVSRNLVSSSVLPMLDSHTKVAPDSEYVGKERVPLRRLDSVGPGYIRKDSILLIKVDTQGFESEVLKGASQLIDRTIGFHLELSLVSLYKDQLLYDEIIETLKTMGFELWAIVPGIADPQTGRLLQADATFFRS
jgi:FkbM family methyltransferase